MNVPVSRGLQLIKKRAFKRFPSHINVRFNCGDTDYSGTITNISKGGMFI
ncbi:MAG: PilZ domain-containing protein, partial [Nitrospiraceae bacterium]